MSRNCRHVQPLRIEAKCTKTDKAEKAATGAVNIAGNCRSPVLLSVGAELYPCCIKLADIFPATLPQHNMASYQ